MNRRVPGVDGKTPNFSLSRRNCICSLWFAAWIVALVTPRLFADITLVSRLSDARAFAVIGVGSDGPAPQIQTDFLPATLRNSASVSAESGGAGASSTSNSSIVADNQMGTLKISGDGRAEGYGFLNNSYGHGSATLIVTTFTLTDRSYPYSLTGRLLAQQFKGLAETTGTAKLTARDVTIFEVVATVPPEVILSQTGVLEPGDYTFSVEVDAKGRGDFGPHAGGGSVSANFNFTLGPTPTPTPTPTASPVPTPAPAQSLNLSTRMRVQTGDNVGIAGFIISGSAPKRVIVRAIRCAVCGPETTPLSDPVLELHASGGGAPIVNDNWRETQEAEIIGTGLAPDNDSDAAIIVTLPPGNHTAVVRGKNNTSGVALVEVYDLNQAAASKLANISTRAFVSTGGDIVIAGFILGHGTMPDKVIVRGIGPSLTGSGVPNALADPRLDLRDSNGALVRSNDNWMDDPVQKSVIMASGLAPADTFESAIAEMLPPGQYTALLAGVNSGTGIGLVEVYDIGNP
jgi:hypothetical protein